MGRKTVILAALVGVLSAGGGAMAQEAARQTEVRVCRECGGEVGAQSASVPRLVQFNGTLKDAAARPVSGAASVTFAIYAEQDGGVALWSETQNVIADSNGHYNALLGGATANGMPAELFGTGQSRWLGVTIARQAEMPRVLLASVPYALKAQDAETLGGLPASDYVTTKSLEASNARMSGPVVAGGETTIVAAPQVASASGAQASPDAIPQATPTGMGTTNFVPIWTSTSALGNSTIFESAGLVGIGTKTPAETLDVNGNSIFRGSFQLPPGHEATAATGYESHSFQFEASAFNSSTKKASDHAFGFRAEPLGNNTTNPTAKLDLFFGPANGTLTDTGLSFSNSGIITFAPGQTFTSTSGTFNEIALPNTTNTTTGVVSIGGAPFLSDLGNTSNTFVGQFAGGLAEATNSTFLNTVVGGYSMNVNTTGSDNTVLGAQSLTANTTGGENIAIGVGTLQPNTTGGDNIGIGYNAGINNKTGNNNIYLGYYTGATADGFSNSTAIGIEATIGASNVIVLGGEGSGAENVGIATSTPISALEVSSTVDSTSNGVNGPAPIMTISNTHGQGGASVAIDFNTSAPAAGLKYNPNARIEAFDEGGFTDSLIFEANNSGAFNNGMHNTMVVHSNGNVEIFGNLHVDGTLDKPAGSFRIDDPIDPTGKYLSHSFVESPDMMNIYNGIVTLDEHGQAVVQMPDWFDALNRDFRYTLTAIGSPAPKIYVAEMMKDNHFRIAGGKKGQSISWMVTGIRQDAWANAHRIPTEEAKPANEQGTYLHPELFGAGADKAVAAKK